MRDPKRIPEILDLLKQLWEKDQDLRFFQMIYTLQYEYSNQNNNIGKIEIKEELGYSSVGFDFFSVEDEQLIKLLKEKLNKN